jgi:hypothetical protein
VTTKKFKAVHPQCEHSQHGSESPLSKSSKTKGKKRKGICPPIFNNDYMTTPGTNAY